MVNNMELHLREKNFISRNNDRGIAFCDEGILILDMDNTNMDLLIDNKKVYIGRTEVIENNRLLFFPNQIIVEE